MSTPLSLKSCNSAPAHPHRIRASHRYTSFAMPLPLSTSFFCRVRRPAHPYAPENALPRASCPPSTPCSPSPQPSNRASPAAASRLFQPECPASASFRRHSSKLSRRSRPASTWSLNLAKSARSRRGTGQRPLHSMNGVSAGCASRTKASIQTQPYLTRRFRFRFRLRLRLLQL